MIRQTRNPWRHTVFLVATVLIAVFLAGPAVEVKPAAAAAIQRPIRLVVLHSYHFGFSWTDSISAGIRNHILSEKNDADIKFEFLDARFSDAPSYFHSVKQSLQDKYAGRAVDVVIASDDQAFNFMLSHGQAIFPDTPLVFCSVSGFQPQMRSKMDMTGLRESIDIRSTVQTALRLHPGTETLAVLLDDSRTGRALEEKTRKACADLGERIDIRYIDDKTVEQLKTQLAELPAQTIVLLFIFKPDESGRVLSHELNLERIRPYCPHPIYSVWDFYLGHGIVGGRLSNGEEEGRMAAEMALRIVAGEPAESIPLEESPVRYMFDYREMQRLGISPALLPEGSVVVNKPFSFYDHYKTLIWIVAAVFTVLIVIIVALFINIAARHRAERTLLESERQYRQLFENANDAIFIAQDGKIVFANQRTSEIIGYTLAELNTIPFVEIIHPEDREMVADRYTRRIAGEEDLPDHYAFKVTARDQTIHTVELGSVLIEWNNAPATLNFVRDITVQKKMEESLRQAQKMEALGTLAGGIAHDFNNLLLGIQGHASLVAMDLPPDDPHLENVRAIEEQVRSAAGLTGQLLGVARGGKYEPKPIELNTLVKSSASLFSRTKKEIRLSLRLWQAPLVVTADRQQIEQVLLNLYVNAWQAMPGGGDLYLETKVATVDEAARQSHQVPPGRYALIGVTDTGVGMDETVRQRVFDPFFTTKEKSRGTGLGLASAYGIIKNHDGFITVYSEIGHGTTFNIYLPLSSKARPMETQSHDDRIESGSETILLVDDEDLVVDVARAMLERLGYRVEVAKGGRQAVEAVEKRGDEFDLVILDLIMPGMDGGKVFDKLRVLRPDLPVLLSSGYAINGQATDIMRKGCEGFIQKPYSIEALSEKIRTILDG